jgi:hypothetical protein
LQVRIANISQVVFVYDGGERLCFAHIGLAGKGLGLDNARECGRMTFGSSGAFCRSGSLEVVRQQGINFHRVKNSVALSVWHTEHTASLMRDACAINPTGVGGGAARVPGSRHAAP